jgi:hypothetical protein
MKTKMGYSLCLLGLIAASSVRGQSSDAAPGAKGTVAILANDRILQGDIERVGDQYRLKRPQGETWLPGAKVRRLCADLEDALSYLRSQANLDDADERLRLSRWCLDNGLRAEALVEVRAAVEIRPGHAESVRLLRNLERSAASDPPAALPAKDDTAVETPAHLPYNAAAYALFVGKVQPILMNTCASCHATGKGGSYKLVRSHDAGGLINPRTTQQNLMASVAHLDRQRPGDSPLLRFAAAVHGDASQPPLKGQNTTAYRTLEEWVNLALANSPRTAVSPPPVSSRPVEPKVVSSTTSAIEPAAQPLSAGVSAPTDGASWFAWWLPQATNSPERMPTGDAKAAAAAEEFATPADMTESKLPPAAGVFATPADAPEESAPQSAEPADPFDPVIFNRQMHPSR